MIPRGHKYSLFSFFFFPFSTFRKLPTILSYNGNTVKIIMTIVHLHTIFILSMKHCKIVYTYTR